MRLSLKQEIIKANAQFASKGKRIVTLAGLLLAAANPAMAENLEEVIVTGTPGGGELSKIDASFSISTLGSEEINKFGPKSTADLFKSVPGVWVESSGGVSGANIQFRGLPAPGDAPFVTVSINNNPVFGAPSLSFFESSTIFRTDETIERMEALRGGPNAIFASGQPGLTTNFVLKEGSEETEGLIKYTTTDYNLDRVDALLSGQLDEDLYYMVGGYVKSSPGIRDTEFTSEEGKQFTLNVTKELENGKINAYTRITDDHGAFYTAIPVGDDREGIDGFDAGTGTYHSNDLRFANIASFLDTGAYVNGQTQLVDGNGDPVFDDDGNAVNAYVGGAAPETRAFDLADGRGWKGTISGVNADFDLGNGWSISNNLGITKGDANTVALFNGDTNTLANLAGAGATGTVLSSGVDVDSADLVSQVGFWVVEKHFQSFSNDLTFSFETDNNVLSFGLYVDQHSSDDWWSLGNNFYVTAEENSQRVAVIDTNGDPITDSNGQVGGAGFALRQTGDARTQAFYVADTFNFSDSMSIDAGVRYVNYDIDMTFDTGVAYDADGDSSTTFDSTSVLDGIVDNTESHEIDDISWTLGFNWNYSDDQGVFARATQGFLLPTFETVRGTANDNDGVAPAERDLDQFEIGYKMIAENVDLFVTLFWNEFTNAQQQIIGDSIIVTDTISETIGLEVDGNYTVGNFSIGANATWLDAEITESSDDTIEGNQPQRIPGFQLRVNPSYDIDLGDSSIVVYGAVSWVDDRFSDLQNEQTLDSYTKADLGAIWNAGENITLQLAVDNLFDEVALTEGDARTAGAQVGVLKGRPLLGRSTKLSVAYNF